MLEAPDTSSWPQYPTNDGAPNDLSISITFNPGTLHNGKPPDIALLTEDSIFFLVHSHLLLDALIKRFRLPAQEPSVSALNDTHANKDQQNPVYIVPETSGVVNVILHTLYDMSCAAYSPSFETLASSVDTLSTYGSGPRPSSHRQDLSIPFFSPMRPSDHWSFTPLQPGTTSTISQSPSRHICSASRSHP